MREDIKDSEHIMTEGFETFKGPALLKYHSDALHLYLTLKALAYPSGAALAGSFGTDYRMSMHYNIYIELIETNETYIKYFPEYVELNKKVKVWSPEISARTLAAIATDPAAKTSDRIIAAKELNVMFDITIVDESGKTKRGAHSLDDFYRIKADAQPNKTH